MGRKLFLVGGSLVFAAIAVAAFFVWHRSNSTASGVAAPEVQAADTADLLIPVTVRARDVVPIPAPIEGTVEIFHVEVGDEVFEGQSLAFIKNTGLESAKEQAYSALEGAQDKANRLESALVEGRLEASRASADASRARSEHDRAERHYKRQQILIREGATPRLAWEKAEREYANVKAELETLDALAKQVEERISSMAMEVENARRDLEQKRFDYETVSLDAGAADLRSPVNGLVVARRGIEGDPVSREVTDLFRIAIDLSTLEAVAEPSPKDLSRIRTGQQALLHFPGLAFGVNANVQEPADGKIVFEFPNPGPAVSPGATGQARIQLTP